MTAIGQWGCELHFTLEKPGAHLMWPGKVTWLVSVHPFPTPIQTALRAAYSQRVPGGGAGWGWGELKQEDRMS